MSQHLQRLDQYFSQNLHFIDELLNIIETEKSAMTDADPELVQATALQKIAVLKQIFDLDTERKAIFAEAAIAETKDGMQTLITQAPQAQQIRLNSKWESLKDKLSQVDKQNTLCGMMINAHRHQVCRAAPDALRPS